MGNKFFKHLKTINHHRFVVLTWCFKLGIPLQGLIHDLSKYSPKEFGIYKYYTGNRSPHDNARDQLGYSPSWLFHRNRNKHHWEYWIDSFEKMNPMKMPYKYVIEMVADFIGAGQAYSKNNWTCNMPLEYHNKFKHKKIYHKDTLELFELLLTKLSELDTNEFLKWYRKNKKQLKQNYNKVGDI